DAQTTPGTEVQASPAAPPAGPTLEQLIEQITDIAGTLVGDEVASETPLMDAGLDSLAAVEFQNMLAKDFQGTSMPSTMMFDFPTAKEIATHLSTQLKGVHS
ncbi:unnamed protein product, partial [Polarella glacialis]